MAIEVLHQPYSLRLTKLVLALPVSCIYHVPVTLQRNPEFVVENPPRSTSTEAYVETSIIRI